jgi:hypothetical protein
MDPVVGIPTTDGLRDPNFPSRGPVPAMTNGVPGLDLPGPLVGPTSKIALTNPLNLLSWP